jgi:two-component system, NarL family, sensor histidine kinase UhpB
VDSLGNVETEPARREFSGGLGAASALASPPVIIALGLVLLAAIGWAVLGWLTRRREREQARQSQAALTERLTALTRRMLSTQEDERHSLSRELHDNLGQICTALCIDIQRAARQPDPDRRSQTLEHAHGVARDMLERVRRMSFELRPLLLDDHGLQNAVSAALADFTAVTGVDVQTDMQFTGGEAPREVAGHVYRILQEALTNVARHAAAQTVDVRLLTTETAIDLTVSDDGHGFEPEALPLQRRFGLLGMRERAELMGGSFRLQSSVHGGTAIHVSIPFKRSGAEGRHGAQSGNHTHG